MPVPIIAGFDPALTLGRAVRRESGVEADEVRIEGEDWGHRGANARRLVNEWLDRHAPAVVAYELVVGHAGGRDAQSYGRIVQAIEDACFERGLPTVGVNVTAAKYLATGKVHAKKRDMVAAAFERWGVKLGHDAADALWMAEWAAVELGHAPKDWRADA